MKYKKHFLVSYFWENINGDKGYGSVPVEVENDKKSKCLVDFPLYPYGAEDNSKPIKK